MQKQALKQEHMPVLQHRTGEECDYCEADASWYHFPDPRNANRYAYACDTHIGLLNRYYG